MIGGIAMIDLDNGIDWIPSATTNQLHGGRKGREQYLRGMTMAQHERYMLLLLLFVWWRPRTNTKPNSLLFHNAAESAESQSIPSSFNLLIAIFTAHHYAPASAIVKSAATIMYTS